MSAGTAIIRYQGQGSVSVTVVEMPPTANRLRGLFMNLLEALRGDAEQTGNRV